MENTYKRVQELLREKSDLQFNLREVDEKLCQIVSEFKGSLVEAIALGLVKLNFASPPGFRGYVKDTTSKFRNTTK